MLYDTHQGRDLSTNSVWSLIGRTQGSLGPLTGEKNLAAQLDEIGGSPPISGRIEQTKPSSLVIDGNISRLKYNRLGTDRPGPGMVPLS